MLLSGEERILQSSGNHLCLNGFLAVLKSLTNVSIPVSIKYSKKWKQTCIIYHFTLQSSHKYLGEIFNIVVYCKITK